MYVDYTPEQLALREELRSYFGNLITPELRREIGTMEGGPVYKDVIRQMGKDGWLGVGWPKQYGGQGMTSTEQMIFFEEARRAGAPLPFVTLNTVGPALMDFGTDAQKDQYLSGILSGDIHFAIGYSEPEAGTDLAALQTSAVRDGDHYIVNGTKIYTSGGDDADYIWLACRTDSEAPKHKGISILIVPTDDPGFSATPIHTVNGGHTCMSYYENVRVPVENLVGPENGGWALITTQLNHERIGLCAFSSYGQKMHDLTLDWAKSTDAADGQRIADIPWVKSNLAEAHALLEALKVMNWRIGWELDKGQLMPAPASAAKVYGTECLTEVYRLLLEVAGAAGAVVEGEPGAVIQGELEFEYRSCQINTFGGGVNEIQRELVAMLGLQMPRAAR